MKHNEYGSGKVVSVDDKNVVIQLFHELDEIRTYNAAQIGTGKFK